MCIPHAPINTTQQHAKREKRELKRHVAFDKARMKPDASFVDERIKLPPKQRTFLQRLFGF